MFRYINRKTALLFLLVVSFTGSVFAQGMPQFSRGSKVYYKIEELRNKHGSNPTVVDWNGDGLKDLVVGYHFYGWIFLYLNSGSANYPAFDHDVIIMQADGSNIESGDM